MMPMQLPSRATSAWSTLSLCANVTCEWYKGRRTSGRGLTNEGATNLSPLLHRSLVSVRVSSDKFVRCLTVWKGGSKLRADGPVCTGVDFMVRSGFREYEVVFSCLQQAGERNVSSSYSRNLERTIMSIPVLDFCIVLRNYLFRECAKSHLTHLNPFLVRSLSLFFNVLGIFLVLRFLILKK